MKIVNDYWQFPENVNFIMAHDCMNRLKEISHARRFTFDLSKTETIHSSFIGFLIHANQVTGKEGGELHISLSPSLKKIFMMLKIFEYFPNISVNEPAHC